MESYSIQPRHEASGRLLLPYFTMSSLFFFNGFIKVKYL